MTHEEIQKEAFMGAAKTLAQAAMKKMDKGVRAVGKVTGKGGKAMADKVKPGVTKGKLDLRTKKVQRGVGAGVVGTGTLAASSMMGGEEKKASREGAQLGGFVAGPIGAAIGAGKGRRARAAGGHVAGGIGGGALGAGLGALTHKRTGGLSTLLGAFTGSAAGSVMGAGAGHDSADKARKAEEKAKKNMKKKAEAIMDKIAAKDPRPEPGYWATQMAGTRAMRRGDTGIRQGIAQDELIGARVSQGLKRMVQGMGVGAAAGGAGGLVTSVLSKGKVKPGTVGIGAGVGAGVGAIIGNDVGSYEADRDFLASKGIKMKGLGFKRPELSDEAKKKYLSTKYQGGGFDTTNKKKK